MRLLYVEMPSDPERSPQGGREQKERLADSSERETYDPKDGATRRVREIREALDGNRGQAMRLCIDELNAFGDIPEEMKDVMEKEISAALGDTWGRKLKMKVQKDGGRTFVEVKDAKTDAWLVRCTLGAKGAVVGQAQKNLEGIQELKNFGDLPAEVSNAVKEQIRLALGDSWGKELVVTTRQNGGELIVDVKDAKTGLWVLTHRLKPKIVDVGPLASQLNMYDIRYFGLMPEKSKTAVKKEIGAVLGDKWGRELKVTIRKSGEKTYVEVRDKEKDLWLLTCTVGAQATDMETRISKLNIAALRSIGSHGNK